MGIGNSAITEEEVQDNFREKYSGDVSKNPYNTRNPFTQMFFSWVGPIISVSRKCKFQQDMHYAMLPEDKISNQMVSMEKVWKKA
jgi:hypothetical protein